MREILKELLGTFANIFLASVIVFMFTFGTFVLIEVTHWFLTEIIFEAEVADLGALATVVVGSVLGGIIFSCTLYMVYVIQGQKS